MYNFLAGLAEVTRQSSDSMIQGHAPANGRTLSECEDGTIWAVVAQESRHVACRSEYKDWHTQSVGHGCGVIRKRLVHALAWITRDPADWEGVLRPEPPLSLVLGHAAHAHHTVKYKLVPHCSLSVTRTNWQSNKYQGIMLLFPLLVSCLQLGQLCQTRENPTQQFVPYSPACNSC
jgi:hypothetical protein